MIKLAEEFKVGDGIIVRGKRGTVLDTITKLVKRSFCVSKGTYLQVAFNNSTEVSWVGGDVGKFRFEYYQKDRKTKKFLPNIFVK